MEARQAKQDAENATLAAQRATAQAEHATAEVEPERQVREEHGRRLRELEAKLSR